MTTSVNMPGGGILRLSGDDFLWFRRAFPEEWKGAVMIRTGDGPVYSGDTIAGLEAKFRSDGVRLAEFTPPDAKMVIVVNTEKVTQVGSADPIINHEKARAVLSFGAKLALAVRETPQEAQDLLDQANPATPRTA
jgi:hypothetical protein